MEFSLRELLVVRLYLQLTMLKAGLKEERRSFLYVLRHLRKISQVGRLLREMCIRDSFDSSGDLLITGIMSIVQLPISTISVFFAIVGILSTTAASVSYTHLDVYRRQSPL